MIEAPNFLGLLDLILNIKMSTRSYFEKLRKGMHGVTLVIL